MGTVIYNNCYLQTISKCLLSLFMTKVPLQRTSAGFIDRTVKPLCRSGENQRIMYSGYKKVHTIKFQSVVAPDGLIANLFAPVEGRRHDSGMLDDSGLLRKLQQQAYGSSPGAIKVY